MTSALVSNPYDMYIKLLKSSPQIIPDYAEHVYMRSILKHLSRFKGGRSLPRYDDVVELCKLKKLYDEHTNLNSKFQLLQRLVAHLITEIKEHDCSYVPPAARTNHAMILFPQQVCATITEPTVVPPQVSVTITAKPDSQTCSTTKVPKVQLTGVKTFKSMQEYRAFVRVGQHPMHASPCVCVKSLKCSNELVFEEWLNHNRTYNDSTTRAHMCRRRRHEHQRQRKHKPTETDHSEEFNQKQVKSIAKSKKGLFPVVHITTHTSVTTIYYDDIVSHRDFISHLQVICKSFASHSSLNKSFTSHCNASHFQVISKSFMSHLIVSHL